MNEAATGIGISRVLSGLKVVLPSRIGVGRDGVQHILNA